MGQMYKKLLLLVIFSILLATPVLAEIDVLGRVGGAFETVVDVASFDFLKTPNQLVGFMRILFGILIFTILFAASKAITWMDDRVRLVVTGIISLITIIFLPGAVILAIGGLLKGLFALLIIVGLLALAAFIVFWTPGNSRLWIVVKFVVVLVIMYLLGLFNLILATAGDTLADLGSFDEWFDFILELAYWGFFILLGYLIWLFFRSSAGQSFVEKTGEGLSGIGERLSGIKTWAGKRWKTRALNQDIKEQFELSLIKDIAEQIENVEVNYIDVFVKAKQIGNEKSKKTFVEEIESVYVFIEHANEEYRKLLRVTRRQMSSSRKVIEKLEEQGVDVKKLEIMENDILKLHEEVQIHLEQAETHYDQNVKVIAEEIKKFSPVVYPYVLAQNDVIKLNLLKGQLSAILTTYIEPAYKKEATALRMLTSIMVETKDLM